MDNYLTPSLAAGGAAAAAVALGTWSLMKASRPKLPYPPGPKGRPLIGNLLDMPQELDWLTYHRMGQEHGDVVHLETLGQHIVVLNSATAAVDLLDHRSAIYSSRPVSPMLDAVMGVQQCNFGTKVYGEAWRNDRRMFHSKINASTTLKFQGLQTRQARLFIRSLLDEADDLPGWVRGVVGATILDTVYGIQITSGSDPFILRAEQLTKMILMAVRPGAFLVEVIPALRHVPEWFPGAGFQVFARHFRTLHEEALEEPVKEVEKNMAAGNVKPCIVADLLEEGSGRKDAERYRHEVKHVAGVAYEAGGDTTTSSMLCFFLAMANYPEVQARAHAELDDVIGRDRLPEFSDSPRLPYINALVWELLRWQPVANLGIPHATTADDEYRGWFIPKGSIVVSNAWAILHDPEDYPEPEEFRPERFLKSEGHTPAPDPRDAAFGYGRRICPGRQFAEQTIFILVASILSAFSISPPRDENGKPVPCPVNMLSGSVSKPAPFKCIVKSRFADAVELISLPLPDRGL